MAAVITGLPPGRSPVDFAHAELAPPCVHALSVERATATVPDRQHRPDPEPDANGFGHEGVEVRYTVRPSTRQVAVDLLSSSVIAKPGQVVLEVLVRRLDHV